MLFLQNAMWKWVFGDIFDEKYVAEDLEEWFDEIKTGDYILAEPINIYEYS